MNQAVKHDISTLSILKIVLTAAIGFAIWELAPLLLIIALSVLLATALDPLVRWFERHSVPRWASLALVAGLLIGGIAFVLLGLVPRLFSQVSDLGQKFGPLRDEAMGRIPPGHARDFIEGTVNNPSALFGRLPSYLARVGSTAASGAYKIGLFLIVAIYLLIDGGRALRWFVTFFEPDTQAKLNRTAREFQPIVFAYVMGQFITSAIVFVYAFALLTILGVPGALTLAVIAATFDILPVIGFLASTFCAVLMALTVSGTTALIVALAYLGYQAIENYVIVPRVYGSRLQVSSLVVLLSFLFAGTLAGVPGALLILPIVAAYPVIEKIWLKRYLGEDVVQNHQAVAEGKTPQSKSSESTADLSSHHEPVHST